MNTKIQRIIQIIVSATIIISCVIYGLYINEIIDFKLLSIRDMNPYGGWSALKLYFTDLSYTWKGFSKSIALSLGITVTAFLFGRFFCGFICPIGAMQELFKYLGRKMNIKEIEFSYKPEIIKYLILIIVISLSILGKGHIISPLSPWLAYLNIFILNFKTGTIILLFIALISLWGRRIFCRYFCPLGAFQSLLYALGPFKIKKTDCDCSYCLRNCPVSEQKRIVANVVNADNEVSPECVNCLKCINTCIKGTKGFKLYMGKKSIKETTYVIICTLIITGTFFLLPLTANTSAFKTMAPVKNIRDGIYLGSSMGFGGIMNMEVTINNKKITNIEILNHKETSGYYEEVFRNMALEIKETQNLNADSISGATSTSRGFINSVKDAVSKSLGN